MRFPCESVVGIEHLDEPALVVGGDGVVHAMNRSARAVFPTADLPLSLFTTCGQSPEALRRYLACCSGARQPVVERMTVTGPTGFIELRCFGSVLVPRLKDRPATILLRLFLGHDTRFSAGAERIRRLTADMRWRLAIERSDELRADRIRIIEQYLFIAEALRQVERQKRELEDEIARVRIDEREHIAQDLHDQAGHELATAIAEIRRMRDGEFGGNKDRLNALADQLTDVGRRLYRAAVGCRPRIVEELGLKRAIEATITAYAGDGGLEAVFTSSGTEPKSIPAVVESAIYRVAQEALTNALKHATGARKLDVQIAFTPKSIALTVADDGAGFSAPPEQPHGGAHEGGLGLRGMRQRMCSIGGTLDITSIVGQGTIVTATALLVAGPMRLLTR
jgi:two-component system sensor histidine kinase DegS